MKDLYKIANLAPFESDASKIKQKIMQRPKGWENLEHVLLHPGRKEIYDRTYANLKMIGLIRKDLNLGNKGFWAEEDLSDFNLKRRPVKNYSTSHSSAQPRQPKNRSTAKSPISARAIFNLFIIIGVAIFYYYVVFEPSQRHGIPTKKTAEQIGTTKSAGSNSLKMHVTSDSLNVRSKPDNKSPILGKLSKYTTVKVYLNKKVGTWHAIIHDGKIAYLHENYLKRGSGYHVRMKECEKLGVSRPRHGTVWSSMTRNGNNSVEVKSQSGSDSIIKLKNASGKTLVTAYVHGGGSFAINRLPGGTYYFQYATGQSFSPSCETFVRGMQASGDPNPIRFQDSQPAIMTYTLYRVRDGNFNPQSVSNEQF